MDSLPEEALRQVFLFLAVDERLKARRVAKTWANKCCLGCAHVAMVPSAFRHVIGTSNSRMTIPLVICNLQLRGGSSEDCDTTRSSSAVHGAGTVSKTSTSVADLTGERKRTRGHLPEPNIVPDGAESSSSGIIDIGSPECCQTRQGVAFCALVKADTSSGSIANYGDAPHTPLRWLDVTKCMALFSNSAALPFGVLSYRRPRGLRAVSCQRN